MKKILPTLLTLSCLSASLSAATPEQEKAFVDKYKRALETSDAATLASFLSTKGAPAEVAEMYKGMQMMGAGQPISEISLNALSPEELAKFTKPREMPDGKLYKFPLKPYKQLVIVVDQKSGDSASKSTQKVVVAEEKGALVIPVPVPAK